jgi:hypothetical protein
MTALAGVAALSFACSEGSISAPRSGQGMLAMKLTDAPSPLDSVKEVNIFVERIDARRAIAEAAEADEEMDEHGSENAEQPDPMQWVTIATPNKTFNLLALQNGITAFLGASPVDTGHFRAIRLIIDPAKSTIVLKDGTVLTTTSATPVEFEKGRRQGLLVELNEAVEVNEKATTTVTLDIRLGESISLRGRTVRDGFFFRPVVRSARVDHD